MGSSGITRSSRRQFLGLMGAAGFGLAATPKTALAQFGYLAPVAVDNPLAQYPSRDWERLYRDIFKTDRSFTFLCCPNDTHNCLLSAFVKNDVVVRIEPTYGYGKARDLQGNQTSHRWDPRCCQKGLVLARRFYGDRRVNGAFLRKGFKEWVDRGFPRDPATGAAPKELMRRGWDGWVRVPHQVAYAYHAKALNNVAQTYSGEQGRKYLEAQGYDHDMIEAAHDAGTRVMKFRGGMAYQGATRIFGAYRFAQGMALLDAKIRNLPAKDAMGGGYFDSYSFHTDLPPGHPMVTGDQTNDFDLNDVENSNLIIVWGMNWITTKMPDSHWLTESRLKGIKTVLVTVEYAATATKCDEVIVIRPGTDPGLALGIAQVLIAENRFDRDFVSGFTDLPSLVRMDTLERVKASDLFPGHQDAVLSNWTKMLAEGESAPPTIKQNGVQIPAPLAKEFADFVFWDESKGGPVAVSHDQLGDHFKKTGIKPALSGSFEAKTVDGKTVKLRTVFDLTREYLDANLTPANVEKLTGCPQQAVIRLARDMAASGGKTAIACGMGPNQFWNNDNKDRALFLILALIGSIGRHGGNLGSYAGNYKNTLFSGMPLYTLEDPFALQTDPSGPIKVRAVIRGESMNYWANGERLMKAGNKKITTGYHVPTPTKTVWQVNSNSSLGNQKNVYDLVFNTLKRCEVVAYNEWWWTASCEFCDVVYGVDSWMEFEFADMTGSNTNPFVQIYPRTGMKRSFNTVPDIKTFAGVAQELAKITGDQRFVDQWKFVHDGKPELYLQRIIDNSTTLRGYQFEELEALAKKGIPALLNTRTTPRINSWEQVQESKPWHTKTGRLEFYRPEIEFIEAGENMVVYREPSEATFYDPCAILAAPHPAIRPKRPADWGIAENDRSHMTRQMRNVTYSLDELLKTDHPLKARGFKHILHTPKYRHGAHTTPVDTDYMAALFGPFGDMYRYDKRTPGTGEYYVDINPLDARRLGLNDGDYSWIDGDPDDLPFRGWQDPARAAEYKVARLMVRVRYYPGTPEGVTRIWHNAFMATPGSVKAHETRPDKLAKNAETNYQALYRYGSHQSLTRSWLKPTHQTLTLITRRNFSNEVMKGANVDIHCVTGAPRETLAKFTKAEDGGIGGVGVWRPASLGFRPGNENELLKAYLGGGFVKISS